jgi:Na+/H+ antiporter NhaB
MTAMRTVLLPAPAIVAVIAVVVGVALEHHTPQPLPRTIASSQVALADDDTDDDNDLAEQEAQQAEQQGMTVEQQAGQ